MHILPFSISSVEAMKSVGFSITVMDVVVVFYETLTDQHKDIEKRVYRLFSAVSLVTIRTLFVAHVWFMLSKERLEEHVATALERSRKNRK